MTRRRPGPPPATPSRGPPLRGPLFAAPPLFAALPGHGHAASRTPLRVAPPATRAASRRAASRLVAACRRVLAARLLRRAAGQSQNADRTAS